MKVYFYAQHSILAGKVIGQKKDLENLGIRENSDDILWMSIKDAREYISLEKQGKIKPPCFHVQAAKNIILWRYGK